MAESSGGAPVDPRIPDVSTLVERAADAPLAARIDVLDGIERQLREALGGADPGR